jgi:hypothetical protein
MFSREQQQHDRAVHGEQLVVLLVRDQVLAGAGELGTHDQRQHAAEEEEREGGDQVQVADHLVVGG